MEIRNDLLETIVKIESENCTSFDKPCSKEILYSEACFVDVKNGRVYCIDCGQCLRYSRKMEERRKASGVEKPPLIKGLDY